MPVLLSAKDLHLSYGPQQLLQGVSLVIESGERVGLIGRNGCGKSSLLRILAGGSAPDSGEVVLSRDLRIGYLPQEFELDDSLGVAANIAAGAEALTSLIHAYEHEENPGRQAALLEQIENQGGWNLEARVKSLATELHAPPLDAPVATLSGGEKRRVALCRALASHPDLLILDEPTNHLDTTAIHWLENALTTFSGGILFVTHDRRLLDTCATRMIEIDHGRAYSHPGNYTAFLESKAAREQIAGQTERRRQRFLRTELEWVRAGVKARTTKSRHRLEQFYEVADQSSPPETRDIDPLIPPAPPLGGRAVELKEVGIRFGSGENERWLFRHLNLRLQPGTCTGVVGPNGTGKTTLLRLCLGEIAPTEGERIAAPRIVANHIDQNRIHLTDSNSVLQELSEGKETVDFGGTPLGARAYLRRYLFAGDRANDRVETLSGGERARLMLAKLFLAGGNFLVLDEPTNDLDLASLQALEDALLSFSGTILCVSHDRFFLDRVCDQIIAFEPDGIFIQEGNYSAYREIRSRQEKQNQALQKAAQPTNTRTTDRKRREKSGPRRLSFSEKRELETIEPRILEAEEKAATIESLLNDPEFHRTRYHEAPTLTTELESLKSEISTLYDRWQELENITENKG